ncbi:hypothetical protein EW146_g4497 [Bondarzewia mesenterica]|uniref:Cytochrome P450 n=1 Tax=Bondarzewia mesenterica TaxID=1095465 RepID=A0A4S4LUI7_9AGAM|nr:hypothetical protein EW146_g4497 [Bondarzewia mesenterica]
MHPRFFRVRIVLDILNTFLVPQLFLSGLLRLTHYNPSPLSRLLLHLSVVPTAGALRIWYSTYINAKTAASLGAVQVPCVRGKWPGNIDIAISLVRSIEQDYFSMQFMANLFDEYGSNTLNTRILWADQFISKSDSNIKYMLSGEGFQWFHKGYYWQERFESFLGNGIFNRDKEEWQAHRTVARPWFSKDRLSDLNLFDRHTTRTIALVTSFAKAHTAFDAQDLFGRFTLDTSSEFLFGNCLNTLDGALPVAGRAKMGPKGSSIDDEFGTFAWAFEDLQVQTSRRSIVGKLWPLLELFNDKTVESNKVVHGYLKGVVGRAFKAKMESNAEKTSVDRTFLDHLVENTDDAESVRYQVLNMLLAGRDTTAITLTFVIYFLCIHPDVLDRLRGEIIGEIGTEGHPSLETMKNLKYLRAVIDETLRFFPPVPINLRLSDSNPHVYPASASDNAPKYYVPPNTEILYNTALMQCRKDLWGADADEFRPDRWLEPEVINKLANNPWMFIPFHAGPRLCLGQNFAYNEMSFFLIRMLQQFRRFELARDAQPTQSLPPASWKGRKGRQGIEQVWPGISVTPYVKGGLWVRAIIAE